MSVTFKSKPDLKVLGPAMRRAGIRAINRTLVSIRQEAQQKIRETVKLKASDVKNAVEIKRASLSRPVGIIEVIRKGIPLFKYGARAKTVNTPRGKRIGVTVQVKGTRKLVRGAFIATMKNGRTGIFKRKGEARLPIRELFSTSVADLFKGGELIDSLRESAKEKLRAIFARESQFEADRAMKKSVGPSQQG